MAHESEPGRGPAGGARGYAGWILNDDDRRHLLNRFPPRFPDVIADHVTLCAEDDPRAAGLSEQRAQVVGHAYDPAGVEALVVEIAGATRRPDGGVYHLTWSLDVKAGRKAGHSNLVIARHGWMPIRPPLEVTLFAATWPSSRYP